MESLFFYLKKKPVLEKYLVCFWVYLAHKRRVHRRLFSNKVNLKVQSSQWIHIHLLKIMYKLLARKDALPCHQSPLVAEPSGLPSLYCIQHAKQTLNISDLIYLYII